MEAILIPITYLIVAIAFNIKDTLRGWKVIGKVSPLWDPLSIRLLEIRLINKQIREAVEAEAVTILKYLMMY